MSSSELIDTLVGTPLSVHDMKTKLVKVGRESAKVLLYSDLARFSTLEQLLNPEGVVILYRQTPTFGHWVSLIPGPEIGMISYFDSYGYGIDDLLQEVDPGLRVKLGQDTPYLTNLISRAFDRGGLEYCDVNSVEVQSPSEKVASCWGYCVLRLLWMNLTNKEFVKLLMDKSGPGTAADRNVALMTALI